MSGILLEYIGCGDSDRRCSSQKYGLTRRVMIPEYSRRKRTPFFVHEKHTQYNITAVNDFIYLYAMCGGAIIGRTCVAAGRIEN